MKGKKWEIEFILVLLALAGQVGHTEIRKDDIYMGPTSTEKEEGGTDRQARPLPLSQPYHAYTHTHEKRDTGRINKKH